MSLEDIDAALTLVRRKTRPKLKNQKKQRQEHNQEQSLKLSYFRAGAAAINRYGRLWISGGTDKDNNVLSTIETIGFTGQAAVGIKLPVPLTHHCMVKLNPDLALIIGGFDGTNVVSQTHFFEMQDGDRKFTDGPPLSQAKRGMACEILKTDLAQYLIVAGGDTGNSEVAAEDLTSTKFATTEYLLIDNPTQWNIGRFKA